LYIFPLTIQCKYFRVLSLFYDIMFLNMLSDLWFPPRIIFLPQFFTRKFNSRLHKFIFSHSNFSFSQSFCLTFSRQPFVFPFYCFFYYWFCFWSVLILCDLEIPTLFCDSTLLRICGLRLFPKLFRVSFSFIQQSPRFRFGLDLSHFLFEFFCMKSNL